jgi:hypothetical protein
MKDEGKATNRAETDATARAKVGRREFLRILGGGAGVGASVVAGTAALTASAHADSETNDEKRKARYRETDHVKAYYRVNRYPTKS